MDDAKPNKNHPLSNVPIEVRVSVGSARPMIKDMMTMGPDTVIPLDRSVEDPVDLYVGDRLIAKGVLEEVPDANDGQLAVRLIEVADLERGLE